MKSIKLLFLSCFVALSFSSCSVIIDDFVDDSYTLDALMSSYDLWYVDYHRTTGTGDVPFISRAFTLSFFNGNLYANNNITDIGITGNGFGVLVGNYNTFGGFLETNHVIDGRFSFNVVQLSPNEIRIYDSYQNVSYYLVGYQRANFDYDMLFYDNIEYFLQEYEAWENTATTGGTANPFDSENYLQFTPENNTTFYASRDQVGTPLNELLWDFSGSYEVFDVQGFDDLKVLTLYYDGGDTEEFELSVLNDSTVWLYHYDSRTTYQFTGRGFIQFLKGTNGDTTVRNSSRKRTKIVRKKIERRHSK